MWEIKFQERSSKNHVIHKVNFMITTKVKRLMLPNILQSEQEWHLESLLNCLSINIRFMNIGSLFPKIWGRNEGSKVGNRARFCRNSQSLGAISPTRLVRLA